MRASPPSSVRRLRVSTARRVLVCNGLLPRSRHAVAVIDAERPGGVLGERVAVTLAVSRADERGDDVEVPLADLRCFAPEVDVELEEVDAAGSLAHPVWNVENASDGITGSAAGAIARPRSGRRRSFERGAARRTRRAPKLPLALRPPNARTGTLVARRAASTCCRDRG